MNLYSFISNSTHRLVISNKKWIFGFNALLNENTLIVPKSTRNLLLEGGGGVSVHVGLSLTFKMFKSVELFVLT